MLFALTGPLRAPLALAIPLALCWGGIILIIDRYLAKSMQGEHEVKRVLGLAIPRLLMAAVIGVVVSTPITLRIFEPEIQEQIVKDVQRAQAEIASGIENTSDSKDLEEVKAEIATLEETLRGGGDAAVTPQLSAAEDSLASAQEERDEIKAQADDAQLRLICEEQGAGSRPECAGLSSGEQGQGPRWQALNQEYQDLQAQLASANQKVDEAQQAVDAASNDAATASQASVDQAKRDAQMRLCGTEDMTQCPGGLRLRQQELEAAIASDLDASNAAAANNRGMLAQLKALDEVTSGDAASGIVFYALMALFFIIEILPVSMKAMVAMGKDHLYDDVVATMAASELHLALNGEEARRGKDDLTTQQQARDLHESQREADGTAPASETSSTRDGSTATDE
jgi:hypothetical protein